jgi:hypothetical protein
VPTVRIFGQEVERKHLLIGGGLIAAAIAVVVFLRARAGASAAQAAPQPADGDQAGYGGGMSVAAPTGAVADQYQQQLDNAQLEAQSIANQYQSNLVKQQQTQFDFQQRMQEMLAPDLLSNEQSKLAAETHYNKTVANTRIACPGKQGVAQAPDGSLYCRDKTSGIPILTDTLRAVEGVVYGARQAAPEVGYDAAKQAAQFYTGKVFAPKTGKIAGGKLPTPPIAPVQMSGHGGYDDHIG